MGDGPRKIRVLHLISNLDRGGAQMSLCRVAPALREHCVLFVGTFRDGCLRQELESESVPVIQLSAPQVQWWRQPRFIIGMARLRGELIDVVTRNGIELVQTHLVNAVDFLLWTLPRQTGLKALLWTAESVCWVPPTTQWYWPRTSLHRAIYRRLLGERARVVAVSDGVAETVAAQLQVAPRYVHVVRSGVDMRRFSQQGDRARLCSQLGIDPGSKLVLTIGRLTVAKGHRYLLEAAVSICRVYPETRFLVVGEGPLRSELESMASRLGLQDRLVFLGGWEDQAEILASTDVFVLPSLWEGFSVALLEAMAAAKPIVATAVAGTVEAMIPEETGLLVPPGDSGELADAIQRLFRNWEWAKGLGECARQRAAACFTVERQAQAYAHLYRQVLEEVDPRGETNP